MSTYSQALIRTTLLASVIAFGATAALAGTTDQTKSSGLEQSTTQTSNHVKQKAHAKVASAETKPEIKTETKAAVKTEAKVEAPKAASVASPSVASSVATPAVSSTSTGTPSPGATPAVTSPQVAAPVASTGTKVDAKVEAVKSEMPKK